MNSRRRSWTTLVGFLAFGSIFHLLLRGSSFGADKDPATAKLKELLGPEVRKVTPQKKKVSQEAKEKLEKALGQTLEAADLEPYLYEVDGVTSPDTGEPMKVRACLAVAKGPGGPIRLGLAVDEKGEIVAARLYEHAEKVDFKAEEFCQQFVGETVSATSYRSPKELEAMLAKAAGTDTAKDPEATKARALLGMKASMAVNGSLTGALKEQLEKRDAASSKTAEALAKGMGDVAGLVELLGVYYKPEQLASLRAVAGGARKAAEEVREFAKKSDWAGATRAFKDKLHESCEKCHNWNDPLTGLGFYKASHRMRADVGVGDGYFILGHDTHPASETTKELSQAVATGLKKALLLLDQTR